MAITAEPLFDEEEAPLAVLTADTAAAIDQLRADARAAAEASRAPSSERAYAADWRDFCAFAARIGRAAAAGRAGDRRAVRRGPHPARPPAGDDRAQARGDRRLPPLDWTTRRRPTTTSCGRSCAAPAGNWAWRSRRRPRSRSTRCARSSSPSQTICAGCAIARCCSSAGRRRCAAASSSRSRSPTSASSPRGSC